MVAVLEQNDFSWLISSVVINGSVVINNSVIDRLVITKSFGVVKTFGSLKILSLLSIELVKKARPGPRQNTRAEEKDRRERCWGTATSVTGITPETEPA
jgi:hypothetical protein